VFRNIYKPLLAESIIEYWGSFRIVLRNSVSIFSFIRRALRLVRPAASMLIVVLAAAFLGNMYFHVLEELELLMAGDPAALWSRWGSRTVYSLLLFVGVWVSMLRQQSRRATESDNAASNLTRVRRVTGVWTYSAIIHIWHIELTNVSPREPARFLATAFGL
jgi:hypothetical protein